MRRACCGLATRTRTRPTSCTACARTSSPTPGSRSATLTKPEVRAVARSLGLATADKPESQEICFVPGGDYRDALRDAGRPGRPSPGPIVDADGDAGRGARRRRRLHRRPAAGDSAWRSASRATSAAIDPADEHDPCSAGATDLETTDVPLERRVVRGRRRRPPGRSRVPGRGPDPAPREPVPATVRPAVPPSPIGAAAGSSRPTTPVWAAAPGQAAVLYDDEVVLGGGRIAPRLNRLASAGPRRDQASGPILTR